MKDIEIINLLIESYMVNYFNTTSSITHITLNALHFINSEKFLKHLRKNMNVPNVHIIIPKDISTENFTDNNTFYEVDDVSYVFGEVHNAIHQNRSFYLENKIDKNTFIQPSVCLNTEGIRLFHTPEGKKQLIHISNIEIHKGTSIGANTVIHRGVFEPTVIGKYVTIGSLVNIGHNCFIDNDTVITPGCVLAGSVKIGKNCWIGINSSFKHGVSICDNVVIGQHSNIRHDITKPGIYAGDPIRKINKYREDWNF